MTSQSVIPLDTLRIIRAELNVLGSFRYANHFPKAIALAASGRFNLRPIATHTFPLGQIDEAFAVSMDQKDTAIKVVVTV
jgi:L-iditol 2-dehydrogenase